MADFYEKMQGIADNLLTRFNQGVIQLGKQTPGTGPVHNPGPPVTVWTLLKGTARGVNGKELFASQGAIAKPDSLIVAGDLAVISKVTRIAQPNEEWLFAANDAWSDAGVWLDNLAWDYVFVAQVLFPGVGDLIRFGGPSGEVWRIFKFDPVPATGVTVAWKFYVRRG